MEIGKAVDFRKVQCPAQAGQIGIVFHIPFMPRHVHWQGAAGTVFPEHFKQRFFHTLHLFFQKYAYIIVNFSPKGKKTPRLMHKRGLH